MAFFDTTWYLNSVGYAAVTVRPQNAAVAAGVIRRQFTAPPTNSERCFVCIIAGTTANVTDATWVLTRGARTTDGTATWQECTGAAAVNGDATNTPTWAAAKAIASAITLGAIIQRNNGASYWICSVAGSTGASEPAWPSDTAGATRTDGTVTWTCIGVVGNFTGGQAPFARMASATAATWWVAGHTLYVGHNHAEAQATAITIAPAASLTTIGKILCHNSAGSYPPASSDLTTGATVSTTANVNLNFTVTNGALYVYGITLRVGVGATSNCSMILLGSNGWVYFDNCSLQIHTTFAGVSAIHFGGATQNTVILNNTTMRFGAIQQVLYIDSVNFIWQNTSPILAAGSAVPNVLLQGSGANRLCNALLEALDLSQISSALTSVGNAAMGSYVVKDCKLHAAVTVNTPLQSGHLVQLVRSDS